MRFLLPATAALTALVAAVASPAGARVDAPGPQCGGTLWKLMTLSDTGKSSVKWAPAGTSLPDIAKLAAPAKIGTTRATAFQKQVWGLSTVVVDRYRMASNGELVLVLYDIPSSIYMDAYIPAPQCLPATTRGRAQILAARDAFLKDCPAVTNRWHILGATMQVRGVGFFDPAKTTLGALKNGAELRPLTGLTISQGCGHF